MYIKFFFFSPTASINIANIMHFKMEKVAVWMYPEIHTFKKKKKKEKVFKSNFESQENKMEKLKSSEKNYI